MRRRLRQTVIEHRHFLVLSWLLILVLTFPTIVYVIRGDVMWLPTPSGDMMMKLWDAWYGRALLSREADFFHTDRHFHPRGVSLVYHNFNLPHMFVFGGLDALLPLSSAFNLTYLLFIFLTAAAAYIYLLYLFKDKWLATFGALLLGISGYVVARNANQPDTGFIATLPLTLYFFHRAIAEKRQDFALIAGVWLGVTAWMGMYIYVCILLSLGMYMLGFGWSRWRSGAFWLNVALLLAAAFVISMPRVYPMMQDGGALESALDKGWRAQNNDLLHYVINNNNPLTMRLFTNRVAQRFVDLRTAADWNTSYIGFVPLLLILVGLRRRAMRRRMLPWLGLLAGFSILRLGTELTINGRAFSQIPMPKQLLDTLLPPVFKAFHLTDLFHAGALLPLAVLACLGLKVALEAIPKRRHVLVILALICLYAFDQYREYDRRIVSSAEIAFVDWLESEDGGALINLPMNRGNSKFYGFHQTLHHRPQVEGLASRTPPQAYDYIEGNALLAGWREGRGVACGDDRATFEAALTQLVEDGFSHVLLHFRRDEPDAILASFDGAAPAYADDFVTIYRLAELRTACA